MAVVTVLFVLLIVLLCIMLIQLSRKLTGHVKRQRVLVPGKHGPPSGLDEYEYMADYMHIPNDHMYIAIPEHVIQAAMLQQQRRAHK